MKKFIFCTLLLSTNVLWSQDAIRPITNDLPPPAPLTAKGNELQLLDQLITITQQNLETQKQLRTELQDYLQIQQKYLQNTNDKQLSFKMIVKAHQLLAKIKEQHLLQAFDREFISELTFFSNIAEKWNTPE